MEVIPNSPERNDDRRLALAQDRSHLNAIIEELRSNGFVQDGEPFEIPGPDGSERHHVAWLHRDHHHHHHNQHHAHQ